MKASEPGSGGCVGRYLPRVRLEFVRKYHQLFGQSHQIRLTDLLMQVRMMVRVLPRIRLQYYLRLQDPYDWLPPVLKHIQRLKEELVSPAEVARDWPCFLLYEPDVAIQREDIASFTKPMSRSYVITSSSTIPTRLPCQLCKP